MAMSELLAELVWIDINDPEVLQAYADIDFLSRSVGRRMGKNDAWIAAATKVTGATLLTTDTEFDHLADSQIIRVWIDERSIKPG
jgi:predicted nucleic acid-binding protein